MDAHCPRRGEVVTLTTVIAEDVEPGDEYVVLACIDKNGKRTLIEVSVEDTWVASC